MVTIEIERTVFNEENDRLLLNLSIVISLYLLKKDNFKFNHIGCIEANTPRKYLMSIIGNCSVNSQVMEFLNEIAPKCIDIKNNICSISDNEVLSEFHLGLINKYGWNYDMSAEDFISNIDNTAPLKYYPINDLKYAPLILMEHLRNKNFIKNITIAPEKWNYTDHHSYNYNFDDSFKIIVDVTTITNKIDNKKVKESNKLSKFAPQQQKMYDYITNKVKKYDIQKINTFQIRTDIKIKEKNLAEAVKKLNHQYIEIYNKEETFKLLSKPRGESYYYVNEEWYKQIINN